jgi:hypothetical protein
MTTMQTEVYNAFRSIGIDEDRALRAATAITDVNQQFTMRGELETLAATADIARLEARIAESKPEILKWMFGAMAAQTITIIGAVLALVHFGHS